MNHASLIGTTSENWHDRLLPVFRQVVDQMHVGICVQDIHGRIEWMNPACEQMFGWKLREIRGRFARDFILPPGRRQLGLGENDFKYDLDSRIFTHTIIEEFVRRDGARFWSQQHFAILDLGPEETDKKIAVTCRDITDQVRTSTKLTQVHANLEFAAYHDDLTGLANRKRLKEFLGSEDVAQALARRTMGVLQLDVDKFKEINDSLGHAAGDATLCHVAAALKNNCGLDGLVCRNGGDEFIFVCLDSGGTQAMQERAEQIMAAIGAPLIWRDQVIKVGTSIGVCVATKPDDTGEDMIIKADKALYSAKEEGRGRIEFYTDELGYKYDEKLIFMRDLETALVDNQLEIHLQPQLSMRSGEIIGCEALIRWQHPERGLVPPGDFLPAAEAAGLAAEIDYISMNLALDALREIRKAGFTDFHMSINVCSSILSDINYPGLLNWALQSRQLDPRSICIEILETTILEGGGVQVATAIERLKNLGVQIALDDFGTGYAGLAHMSSLDVDAIKLDRSMILRMAGDPRNRMIIRSIIRLCDSLGINVVAEGVEHDDQLEILRRAHCPIIQGYGIARPMALDQMLNWLDANCTPPGRYARLREAPDSPLLPAQAKPEHD